MLDHPKWRRALREGGDGAFLLWMRLSSWCSRRLTDGVVPGDLIEGIGEIGGSRIRARQLRALFDAGLLTWCAATEDSTEVRRGLVEPAPRQRHEGDDLVIVGYLARDVLDERIRREARSARPIAPNDVCAYCCQPSERMTIDHVIPICQGGGNDPWNLVPACFRCNSRKGGRTPEQAGMVLA